MTLKKRYGKAELSSPENFVSLKLKLHRVTLSYLEGWKRIEGATKQ